MLIQIITPSAEGTRSGNETTTRRWAGLFEGLGHTVSFDTSWRGEECDALVALHAWKSFESIREFHRRFPDRPLIVALTGTDLYGDLERHPHCWRAIEVATSLVVLQPLALRQLPRPIRTKAHVIHQSVPTLERKPKKSDTFDVCVVAHLRTVKDPFRAALAAQLLPADSKIRVLQLGGALESGMELEAKEEERRNRRYRWLGNIPREEVLDLLASSDLMVNSSEREGGANAVGEAIAASLPVVASRIPGNVGMLGEDYPGYFEVRDTLGLSRLLLRAEREPDFLAELRRRCVARQHLYRPEEEARAWRELLETSVASAQDVAGSIREISSHILEDPMVEPPTGSRFHPRLPILEQGEIQLWPGDPARSNTCEIFPVVLYSVSAEGLGAELPIQTIPILPEVAAVTIYVKGFPAQLVGRRQWTAPAEHCCRMGIYLQLAAVNRETRRAFVEWVKGLRARSRKG